MKESYRWIGRKLNRGHTDIAREVKRNSSQHFLYRAVDAQRLYEARQLKKNRKKLEKCENQLIKRICY